MAQRRKRERPQWERELRQERERWELERQEQERDAIAAFGDDVHGLGRWFNADERRRRRHWPQYRAIRERLEKREIIAFGDDLEGLRRWFDGDESRSRRHPSEHATLLQQERRRQRHELAELSAFGNDLDGLRRWFNAVWQRRERHSSKYAALLQRERRREQRKRERWESQLREREQAEITAFGDDIDSLRQWFNADLERKERHTTEYATLRQLERGRSQQEAKRVKRKLERRKRARLQRLKNELQERAEMAAFGDDLTGLRRWFDTYKVRSKHYPSEYAALKLREQERRERRKSELQEREQTEIVAFGDDLAGLRRWFSVYKVRQKRHSSEYAALELREQERRERRKSELQEREQAEIVAFGDDLAGLRRWFDTYKVRQKRHPSEYLTLKQREQERDEIVASSDDIDGLRQ